MRIDTEEDTLSLGGKSSQLHRLREICADVPPFFTVEFDSSNEVRDPHTQKKLVEYCVSRGFDLVAVRSSASCEDAPETSFAGMFKTILNVRPPRLADAISEVLHSVHNKRVIEYCKAHDLDPKKISMSVIIQKMVRSRVSGVCFTRIDENPDALMIEACYGLGESLVSGKITPDTYIVDRESLQIIKETIGYQKIYLPAPQRNEKTSYQEIPFHKRNSRKISHSEIRNIAEKSLKAERHLNLLAADIEWAIENDVVYILQARPYTGYSEA